MYCRGRPRQPRTIVLPRAGVTFLDKVERECKIRDSGRREDGALTHLITRDFTETVTDSFRGNARARLCLRETLATCNVTGYERASNGIAGGFNLM